MHRFRRTTRISFPIALAGLALIGMACGGGGGGGAGANEPGATKAPAGADAGPLQLSMGDNFFDQGSVRNPTLEAAAGATIEIALSNDGAAIHDMRFAGDDNRFNTSDDAVVPGGGTATLKVTVPEKAGAYNYQCDVHPAEMKGTITVK